MPKKVLITIAVILLAGVGFFLLLVRPVTAPEPVDKQEPVTEAPVPENYTRTTFYVPENSGDSLKYCNGSEMDSAGFAKTLTKKITRDIKGELSIIDKIKNTLSMAANEAKMSPNLAKDKNYITMKDGIVYVKQPSGWAGVSIFFCSWKPLVEKNLMQFGEIKQVVWL